MAQAAFHTQESFERALAALIDKADAQARGADLDRIRTHIEAGPAEVSPLARLLFVLDEDFRTLVEQHIESYRRWLTRKGQPAADADIFAVMLSVYQRKRGLDTD